ncbi:MAG: glycosyltransferase [Lachnospiraceae bacterium]|nr:glycosyltransferase [Lachnospiraceae bacterium]
MKTITVVVPTYNEEGNIQGTYDRLRHVFETQLPQYRLEILYIDNLSTDRTRAKICSLAEQDDRVKAIFNARNFGYSRSIYYGLSQATGDAAVLMNADMQDPPEVIPEMVRKWEEGSKVVVGIKNKSRESRILYFIRQVYYRFIKKISEIEHIEQYDGFGLYDQSFIRVLREVRDSNPYLRGIVSELGFCRSEVYYEQDVRKAGKTKFNFFRLYDVAMLGITSYSKVFMRLATFSGLIIGSLSIATAIFTLVRKLLFWSKFPIGTAAISIGVFFFGGIQLFFIGIIGEYISNINIRVMGRPLVVEERRINFPEVEEKKPENKEECSNG